MLHGSAELPDPSPVSLEDSRPRFAAVMRATHRVFEGDFARLVPSARHCDPGDRPLIAETERISFDFLVRGGKRVRPFVTLAAYLACQDESAEAAAQHAADLPAHVKRAAIAIEAFHKASLVHDDIEDGDLFRYGQETLHRQHDTATAINVGDYLIGLGYRLITGDRGCLGAERAADILHRLMDAHVKLSEGQGAELAWRRRHELSLSVEDVLDIYALKTSPAFEAALYTGVRLAGEAVGEESTIRDYCRHLGVAFQIRNDLSDWFGDDDNKLVAGQDAVAMRPTFLLAAALDAATHSQKVEIEAMLANADRTDMDARRLRAIFQKLGVFARAHAAVERSRAAAQTVADSVGRVGLGRLLGYLMETVLAPLDSRARRPSPLNGEATVGIAAH